MAVYKPESIPKSEVEKLLSSKDWTALFCLSRGGYKVWQSTKKWTTIPEYNYLIMFQNGVISVEFETITPIRSDETKILHCRNKLGITIVHANELWNELSNNKESKPQVNIYNEDICKIVSEIAERTSEIILSSFDNIPTTSEIKGKLKSQMVASLENEGGMDLIGLKVDSFVSSVNILEPISIARKRSLGDKTIVRMSSEVSGVYENLTIKGTNTYLNNVIVLENLILDGMDTTGKALLAKGVSVQSKSINTKKLEVVQGNQVLIMKALIGQEKKGSD